MKIRNSTVYWLLFVVALLITIGVLSTVNWQNANNTKGPENKEPTTVREMSLNEKPPQPPPPTEEQKAKKPVIGVIAFGKEVFQDQCVACHGYEGKGQKPDYPKGGLVDGAYVAPALDDKGKIWEQPDPVIYNIIKDGPTNKKSGMPAFKEKLSHDQIIYLILYLHSLWSDDVQKKRQEARQKQSFH